MRFLCGWGAKAGDIFKPRLHWGGYVQQLDLNLTYQMQCEIPEIKAWTNSTGTLSKVFKSFSGRLEKGGGGDVEFFFPECHTWMGWLFWLLLVLLLFPLPSYKCENAIDFKSLEFDSLHIKFRKFRAATENPVSLAIKYWEKFGTKAILDFCSCLFLKQTAFEFSYRI